MAQNNQLNSPEPFAIASGGTGVASVTSSPAASAWSGWDANKNLNANNFNPAYTTTVTAAGTTTLVVGSAYYQFFTGTTTQTVLMPVTSTLAQGQSFYLVNNSTGAVTVQSSGANNIVVMAANTTALLTCILTSGTTAASWNADYVQSGLTLPISVGNGGTGLSTLTAHNVLIGAGTSNVVLVTPTSNSGIPLVSNGSSSDPSFSTTLVRGGGTGLTTTTAYGVITAGTTTTGNFQNAGTGATGTIFQGAGSSAVPTWSTTTYPSTNAINTIMYASSANVLGVITPVNSAVLISSAGGVPSWATTLPAGISASGMVLTSPKIITSILDTNGNVMLAINPIGSAVNYIGLTNASTGGIPALNSTGTDAAVPFYLQTKNSNFYLTDTTQTIAPAMRWYNAASTHFTGLKVATAQATDVTFVLPAADGTANAPIITDGSGNLSFLAGSWNTFTPTCTGFTGTPTTEGRYQILGKTCNIFIFVSGTSNATTFTITNLPATAANSTHDPIFTCGQIINGGVIASAVSIAQISHNSTTITFFTTPLGGVWVNTGTKGVYISLTYETT